MKFLKLAALAALSLAFCAGAAVVPPIYYPPYGTYYVYSVPHQLFFNNAHETIAEGNPIIGYSMTQPKYTNEQFLVEAADATTGGYIATIRVLETVQQNASAGGYVRNSNGALVHSAAAEAWTLQPVAGEPLQYMIVDGGVAITLNSSTSGTQLTAEAADDSATNQRWMFVPIDQIDDFDAENDVPVIG